MDPGFNLDEILHMDSIPGLANILADDSLDFGSKDSDGLGLGLGGRKAESGGVAGESGGGGGDMIAARKH